MKVTRVYQSKNLTQSKLNQLTEIAKRLGILRSNVWQEYGSLKGVGITHRQIRDKWLMEEKKFNIPARLWKETLRDVFQDIELYKKAAKRKVRKAISKRYDSEQERKEAYQKLRSDEWVSDNYLHRMMRKYFKHGHTKVNNQIILDSGCYTSFEKRGKTWINVMTLNKRKRIAIPLNVNTVIEGAFRLILRNGIVEIHQAVDVDKHCNVEPCGYGELGVDKGYTEVFVDSNGEKHGEGLGKLLSKESDFLKQKYQRRNKLRAIVRVKPHKKQNIIINNLGCKKLNNRRKKYVSQVKDCISKAVHSVVDKTRIIVIEDLTKVIKFKNKYSKNQKRRLSGWVKGIIADLIKDISSRRCASIVVVNAAYTSQVHYLCGCFGTRRGDSFYCPKCKVVEDADHNAAVNILLRKDDSEINRWMPYRKVKSILQNRNSHRLGLLNLDSSCSNILSTESELPF